MSGYQLSGNAPSGTVKLSGVWASGSGVGRHDRSLLLDVRL
jgi:hypothetical protein